MFSVISKASSFMLLSDSNLSHSQVEILTNPTLAKLPSSRTPTVAFRKTVALHHVIKACLPSDASAQPIRLPGTAGYHPSVWSDQFISSPSATKPSIGYVKRIEELKKEVKDMLSLCSSGRSEELNLIDKIQRLGLAYHFEKEIEVALKNIYDGNIYVFDEGVDDCATLNITALQFRLLRQAGYYVSPGVFDKFKDKNGKFHSNLAYEVNCMLSLYQASYYGFNGEDIMDDAMEFTTKHLKSMASLLSSPLRSEVERALRTPLQKSVERLEAMHYIYTYRVDEYCNRSLLEFAKLDFNMVQLCHQEEIKELSRWWDDLDIKSKLPFETRDRVVEAYATIMGIYFEPKYSSGRILVTKMYCMLTVLDDAFDVYGDLNELEPLTNAFQRWDETSHDDLQYHMREIFLEVLEVINEAERNSIKSGNFNRLLGFPYLKQEMKVYTKGLLDEARILFSGDIPTFEEWLPISLVTVAIKLLVVTTILNVEEEFATREVFDWVTSMPKVIECSYLICRLIDDIATFKVEKSRGIILSCVSCRMKDHGISESEANNILRSDITRLWKDINQECMKPNFVPMRILKIVSNWPRLAELYYADGEDGYTNSKGRTKEIITSLYFNPIPL